MDDVDTVISGYCRNCGCNDYIVDYQRGSYTCAECACIDLEQVMVNDVGFKASHDLHGARLPQAANNEPIPYGPFSGNVFDDKMESIQARRNNSPPYRRETYFAERISQWRMLEPEIDPADFREIEQEYLRYTGRFYIPGLVHPAAAPPPSVPCKWSFHPRHGMQCDFILDKEDLRKILWRIDKRKAGVGGAKPVFVKRYLVSFFIFSCPSRCRT